MNLLYNLPQKQRRRERKTLFGCIEPKTGMVITSIEERVNTISFFRFLLKTTQVYSNQKVIMVVDNIRYHHTKRLKPILEKYKHRIELIYLPAYSPDLNPMERLWWYMEKKITHNRYVEKMAERICHFNLLMNDFKIENQIGKNLANLMVNI